jgi:hypothetical protein
MGGKLRQLTETLHNDPLLQVLMDEMIRATDELAAVRDLLSL